MTFQAYLDNIHKKSGKSPEDWNGMAGPAGAAKPPKPGRKVK